MADARPDDTHELIRQAALARVAGDVDSARASYAAAYDLARQSGDLDVMTEAALGLASGQTWGVLPGRTPAFLHQTYTLTAGVPRARLAVALARAWVYAGNPARATEFAREAIGLAERAADATLLAEALDADLLVHWGPDDFAERLRITTRLEDTVAHVTDVEARMSAYLWRLTTALESLDIVGVLRQLRALDLLAEETGSARVRFFASSRRGMYALLVGDVASAMTLLDDVRRAGTEAGEPDTFALEHTLAAGIARQLDDRAQLAREAAIYEEFGTRDGLASVTAEAALLWLTAGSVERARTLLDKVAGADFGALIRDVEWLLTMASLAEVAAATGATDLAAAAVDLLEPYAGRAVVNAGAVAFCGVVEDYLSLLCMSLGRTDDAGRWARAAAASYQRIASPWWLQRVGKTRPQQGPATVLHLQPGADGIWTIGAHGHTVAMREMKGLRYLRLLLQQPGVAIAALDLSDAVAGHAGAGVNASDVGAVIDRHALAAYRLRLVEIDEELREASEWADSDRIASVQAERHALLDEIAAATGLHGRRRRTGATAERARVAVRKAVAAAVSRIEEHDPVLARLLRDTVHTGSVCQYDPDPSRPVQWVLDTSAPS